MPIGNFEEDKLLVGHPDRGLCHVNLEQSFGERFNEASGRVHAHELVAAAKNEYLYKLNKKNQPNKSRVLPTVHFECGDQFVCLFG
jgi:hypothetical protein